MTDKIVTPLEQHSFYMLLFNLIFRHNDRLRLDAAEAIRLIVCNPDSRESLSPAVLDELQSLRTCLLEQPQPEIVSMFLKPPVSLVGKNDNEKKT
jgi:hypothetical protein